MIRCYDLLSAQRRPAQVYDRYQFSKCIFYDGILGPWEDGSPANVAIFVGAKTE